MRNLIKDRKGADKLISVYWFAILFIVAAAIVYMVSAFYGKPYDIRRAEADILTDKVAGCYVDGGYLIDGWENINSENFLQECGLTFNVEDVYGWSNNQHYVEVNINSFSSGQEISGFFVGNVNFEGFCGLEGGGFPVCLERSFYSLDRQGNQYEINILSIVRKTEKNVQ